MLTRNALCLLGALLTCGACQNNTTGNDLGVTVYPDLRVPPPPPADMTAATGPQEATISDLNNYKVANGTQVKFTGVVIGPFSYVELDKEEMVCNYNIFVAQANAKPTLQDGIEVVFSKKVTLAADLGLTNTLCREQGVDDEINKIMTGHAVQITGTFSASLSGGREVDLAAGTDLLDQGMAQMQPMPVMVTAYTLGTGYAPAFTADQGAFVQYQNVMVTAINSKYQDFTISDGKNMAVMAANFLTTADSNFMAPMVGTKLKSVTGIVFPDFGGTVWPRSAADVVPQ